MGSAVELLRTLRGQARRLLADGGLMKDLAPHTVPLESDKVKFLEQMASTYRLDDIGKAVRCLINYARENPDRHEEIFGEVRCLDC